MSSGVRAILLAAGQSRRLGGPNKLTLTIDGVPLLRRSLDVLLASGLDEVVVVTGHQSDHIEPLIADRPVRRVHNPDYPDGQMSSVHAGLRALTEPCAGVMVALADQALLRPADIDRLIAAFVSGPRTGVLVPTFEGRRGNPIILAWPQRQAILSGAPNLGCRKLIDRHPDLVTTLAMPDDRVLVDLDRPGDLDRVRRRLAEAAAPTDTAAR